MLVSPRLLLVALALTTTTTFAQEDDDVPATKKKGRVSFGIAKGFQCHGDAECHKGMERHCEGGMSQNFTMHAHPMDILDVLTHDIHNVLTHDFLPAAEDFMPDNDIVNQLVSLHQNEEAGEHLDMKKTIEFGGTVTMEWGCKVTYAMKKGAMSKESECGFKAKMKSGKKTGDENDHDSDPDTMM